MECNYEQVLPKEVKVGALRKPQQGPKSKRATAVSCVRVKGEAKAMEVMFL